ncbi:MAG TPA: hypothetical protein DCM05_08955 [Elusimicrobia bacterium]|nr:hypothetical protein [Elusimicrobiota bacterium]
MTPTPSAWLDAAASRLGLRLALLAAAAWTASAAAGIRLPSMSPASAAQTLERLEDARAEDEPRKALRQVRRLLRSFPERPEYLRAEAELLTQLRDMKGAAADWEEFLAVAPFPAEACPQLGRAYEALGLPERGLDAHRRCYELDEGKPDPMLFYALALSGHRRYDEAEKLFQRILEISPGYTDARVGLIRVKIEQNRLEEAEKLLPETLRIAGGKSADALLTASMVAEKRGERERGRAYLRDALKVSPSYTDLYRRLGRLCEQDGLKDEAKKVYASLLEIQPSDAPARRRLRTLEAGK